MGFGIGHSIPCIWITVISGMPSSFVPVWRSKTRELTASPNVYVDNWGRQHSCSGLYISLKARVVRAGAVPYKACADAAGAGQPALRPTKESLNGVEESGRRPLGFGSEGTVGLRTATGRAEAAGSGRSSAPRPGPHAAIAARRLFQRARHCARASGRRGDLGHVGLLPRAVRRTR